MELYHVRKGNGKQKILFVHGNTASTKWWLGVMDALKDEYDMLAVDLAGYGQSSDCSKHVTLDEHAQNIKDTVEKIGFKDFVMVGHSLGAAVTMQTMIQYPEYMSAGILMDSCPIDGYKGVTDWNVLEQSIANDEMLAMALKLTFAKPIDEALWEEIIQDCYRRRDSMLPNTRMMVAMDLREAVKAINKPVLVLHGEQDALIPQASSELAAKCIPNARFSVIPDAGHNPQLENEAGFLKELRRFVNEVNR